MILIKEEEKLKKMMSLLLSLAMILSAAGMITAGAAEVTTSFKDETGFNFSFENESDFTHPDMVLVVGFIHV